MHLGQYGLSHARLRRRLFEPFVDGHRKLHGEVFFIERFGPSRDSVGRDEVIDVDAHVAHHARKGIERFLNVCGLIGHGPHGHRWDRPHDKIGGRPWILQLRNAGADSSHSLLGRFDPFRYLSSPQREHSSKLALGVTLLGVNVVLQVLLLPLYLRVFADQQVGVEIGPILESIMLFLALPLGLAALTRAGLRRRGVALEHVMRRIRLPYLKTLVLAAIIISMFAVNATEIFDNPSVVLRLLAPISAFFAIAFALSVMVGRIMGFPYEQIVALVFTTTSRNSEASLAIAATAFASPFVALTVVMGPVIELPLLVLMVRALRMLRPRMRFLLVADAT